MWERLAAHQPYADQRGYGEAWAAARGATDEATGWIEKAEGRE